MQTFSEFSCLLLYIEIPYSSARYRNHCHWQIYYFLKGVGWIGVCAASVTMITFPLFNWERGSCNLRNSQLFMNGGFAIVSLFKVIFP